MIKQKWTVKEVINKPITKKGWLEPGNKQFPPVQLTISFDMGRYKHYSSHHYDFLYDHALIVVNHKQRIVDITILEKYV